MTLKILDRTSALGVEADKRMHRIGCRCVPLLTMTDRPLCDRTWFVFLWVTTSNVEAHCKLDC
eukprot:m.291054 g.291054  ORF g.291054 m.291054 type:complete len:63 (-) comp15824_c0_seq1:4725-4913(-)